MARGSKSGWQEGGLPRHDLTGIVFGKLTVVGFSGRSKNKSKRFTWNCRCECGGSKVVETSSLNNGKIKDCGCTGRSSEFRRSRARHKGWGESLRNKILDSYKRNARKRSLVVEIPDSRFFEMFGEKCFYCGSVPSRTVSSKKAYGTFTYNGVDRLDNSIGYIDGNVVSCCAECNYKKGDQHFDNFSKWVTLVADNLRSKHA